MKELYELKDNLCDELKKYGKKEITAGSLDVVDKLSHAIKNIEKIIENGEGEYSNAKRNYRGNENRTFEGIMSRSRYPRDGYSYEGMMDKLYALMEEAPDDKTRLEFRKFIQKLENM